MKSEWMMAACRVGVRVARFVWDRAVTTWTMCGFGASVEEKWRGVYDLSPSGRRFFRPR